MLTSIKTKSNFVSDEESLRKRRNESEMSTTRLFFDDLPFAPSTHMHCSSMKDLNREGTKRKVSIFITKNIFVNALDLILHVQYFIASTVLTLLIHILSFLFTIVKQSSLCWGLT